MPITNSCQKKVTKLPNYTVHSPLPSHKQSHIWYHKPFDTDCHKPFRTCPHRPSDIDSHRPSHTCPHRSSRTWSRTSARTWSRTCPRRRCCTAGRTQWYIDSRRWSRTSARPRCDTRSRTGCRTSGRRRSRTAPGSRARWRCILRRQWQSGIGSSDNCWRLGAPGGSRTSLLLGLVGIHTSPGGWVWPGKSQLSTDWPKTGPVIIIMRCGLFPLLRRQISHFSFSLMFFSFFRVMCQLTLREANDHSHHYLPLIFLGQYNRFKTYVCVYIGRLCTVYGVKIAWKIQGKIAMEKNNTWHHNLLIIQQNNFNNAISLL